MPVCTKSGKGEISSLLLSSGGIMAGIIPNGDYLILKRVSISPPLLVVETIDDRICAALRSSVLIGRPRGVCWGVLEDVSLENAVSRTFFLRPGVSGYMEVALLECLGGAR